MTNTDTADVMSTVNQTMALAAAGSELVRVTVNTDAAARAVPKIVETLDRLSKDHPRFTPCEALRRKAAAGERFSAEG